MFIVASTQSSPMSLVLVQFMSDPLVRIVASCASVRHSRSLDGNRCKLPAAASQPLGFTRVSSNLIVDANMKPLLSQDPE